MRKLLLVVLLFLSNTLWAYEYPPKFEKWDSPPVVTDYREFKYSPAGLDAVFSKGKIDSVVTYKENTRPEYILITMPGGYGTINLVLDENKKIKSFWGWNTFTRMRKLFAQNGFYVITIDATDNANKITAIVDALAKDYPGTPIYIAGISLSTRNTMSLAQELDGKLTGFIHTSAMGDTVSRFNTKNLRSKNVLIHNKNDSCTGTPYSSAKYSAEEYGTQLITLEEGENYERYACGAFTIHGFYQSENQLFNAIMTWIRQ